jgi:hypothetical protein
MLALYIGLLDVDFEVVDAPGFAEQLHAIAARFQRAAGSRALPARGRQPDPFLQMP